MSTKSILLTEMGAVEDAVVALGAAYRRFQAAYELAYRGKPNHVISNIASTIGPDRSDEDIVGAMNAAGLAPLLGRARARGGDGRHYVTDLRGEFKQRLLGVGSLLD